MKFTLSWLKNHLETEASLATICATLTALGLEVEGMQNRAALLAPFKIVAVLEAAKHPNADRLRVCKVDTGSGILQVVCGAPNARGGMKTVLARPGDIMPESGEALKASKIREVESQGMLCAADELGLGDDHDGIIDLPPDAPVGATYAGYAGLDDPVIELKLTPNRPDCAGIEGLARELATAGIGRLKPTTPQPHPGTFQSPITVSLHFPEGQKHHCPHFVGRLVKGIKNGPSPAWLQNRLTAIGLRPISALVDITNFLTFAVNRPLHVFDAAKIKGQLVVRPAREGEQLAALNGKTYTLQEGMTVIADEAGVESLGGIMGGAASGCSETTTDVFIEAAYFDPIRTSKTGRLLQVTSDARWRFERGIDPAFTQAGMELATQMVLDLCGTAQTQVSDLVVAGAAPNKIQTQPLRFNRCRTLAGVDVPVAEQIRILTALGFQVAAMGDQAQVTVPSWRPDIEGEADLVEEIMRVYGFDRIPAVSMTRQQAVTHAALTVPQQRVVRAKNALVQQGLLEAVTWSFMAADHAKLFGWSNEKLRLLNPISSELDVMRPSIVGNLALAAKRNADRGFPDLGLFEVGPVFMAADAQPESQQDVATALRAGNTPRHWQTPPRAVDVFDAKADALAVLAACGAPAANCQITTDAPAWYHPGRSGTLRLGPLALGFFGELHPALLQALGIETPMVAAEVFINAMPLPKSGGTAKPLLQLAALQPVQRDFAFLVDDSISADKLVKAIRQADKALITDVQVFDVYAGKGVATGKKSVACAVTLQPDKASFTEQQLDDIAAKVVAQVAKATGGTLRG